MIRKAIYPEIYTEMRNNEQFEPHLGMFHSSSSPHH